MLWGGGLTPVVEEAIREGCLCLGKGAVAWHGPSSLPWPGSPAQSHRSAVKYDIKRCRGPQATVDT